VQYEAALTDYQLARWQQTVLGPFCSRCCALFRLSFCCLLLCLRQQFIFSGNTKPTIQNATKSKKN